MPVAAPANLSIRDLSAAIAAGRLSPVELLECFLDRVRILDPKLHAFVDLHEADARRHAEEADAAIRSNGHIGPLHGIPIAIKDLVEIEGRVTTAGSQVWRNRVSTTTATLVRKLGAAGMIVMGKTHTVEFAIGGWGTNQHRGTPWNPWDLLVPHGPGGSSSGSGVAVAAGLAPCAVGTDTGGSVRLPASFCGIVGLRPTIGRISLYGVVPVSPTLDTAGPMTRSVEDAALLFNVLQGPDPLDRATLPHPPGEPLAQLQRGLRGLRLAVMPKSEREGVDPEVLTAYDASIETLARGGAEIVEVSLPLSLADYGQLCADIMIPELYSYVGDIAEQSDLPLDEDVRQRILPGRSSSTYEYLRALRHRDAKKREFAELFAGFDALLTPTTPMPAVPLDAIDQISSPARFTRWVGFLNLCALALPNGFTRGGLPISLQIVGKSFDEATVLRIGWAYEEATEWHERRPPGI